MSEVFVENLARIRAETLALNAKAALTNAERRRLRDLDDEFEGTLCAMVDAGYSRAEVEAAVGAAGWRDIGDTIGDLFAREG